MASVSVQVHTSPSGPVRPMNVLRDLPQVADLIELCFSSTMDEDGQSFLQEMRRASRDNNFLRWAGQVMDSASLPMTGFVWEENGRIVGNASVVPQNFKGRKISMIANVATHPDFRRRGIGRALTERALQHARQKGAKEIWLHVRDDNPTAIKIYEDLGFVERTRRTTYYSAPDALLPTVQDATAKPVTVSKPNPRDWSLQREWLRRAHPDELNWYSRWDWDELGPGLWNFLRRSMVEFDVRQWAAMQDGKLLATVSWMPSMRASNALWIAAKPDGDASGLRSALEAARRELTHYRKLAVEYPTGEMVGTIQSAGFTPFRTLIWMRATS
ncbi:MAG: GNAT family N-acetyltransferase [Chloroflexi bacterium]|nr:GNAT family N-acetyltransferase [Chloroflexota bacterium]